MGMTAKVSLRTLVMQYTIHDDLVNGAFCERIKSRKQCFLVTNKLFCRRINAIGEIKKN